MLVFSKNLKKIREKRGMSRAELAEKISVSVSTLAYYEQGRREPDLEKVLAISQILSVSADELLGNVFDRYGVSCSSLALYGVSVNKKDGKECDIKGDIINEYRLRYDQKEIVFNITESHFCTIVEISLSLTKQQIAEVESGLLVNILKRAELKLKSPELGDL